MNVRQDYLKTYNCLKIVFERMIKYHVIVCKNLLRNKIKNMNLVKCVDQHYMHSEHNFLICRHKITLDGLKYRKINQPIN